MADKPITFSAPMVRALLAGTKTQTRRLIKPCPWPEDLEPPYIAPYPEGARAVWHDSYDCSVHLAAPIAVGDRVYVREAYYQFGNWEPVEGKQTKGGKQKWAFFGTCMVRFDAPEEFISSRGTEFPGVPRWYKRLGRFMPRAESRMWLEITDVRVQRLQDISEDDALAEGALLPWTGTVGSACDDTRTARGEFSALWDSLHTEPGTTWADNPWIVAYTFKVHHGNIDGVEHNGFPGQVEREHLL